jgi:hypothetical protein
VSDFQGLTKEAADLLSQGRHHRLTEQQLLQLTLHLKMIASWADRVPQNTRFFFVEWQPVLILPRVDGLSREELAIAAYLQPLHSHLGAIALQVLWKANQLIRTLCNALNSGDLIVAATMARSLVETAAAFGCESDQVAQLWRTRCRHPAPDVESLSEFMDNAHTVVGQILFGTKLKREKTPETGIERTNILTLIDRAEKLSENPGIRRLYDVLCDTVHPSIGSNRCFWSREPGPEEGPVFEFVTQRTSRGELSELPFTIGFTALWALTWLGWMWNLFDRTRKDLCLTAKIYALPAVYYGIIRPGKPEDYCPCGSTKRSQVCAHYFGRPEAIVDASTPQSGDA